MSNLSKIPQYASCLLVDIHNPKYVLLIKKNRPDWQKGMLNIIGGHIEEGEVPVHAAIREVFEETGLKICLPRAFCNLTTLTPDTARVFFFVSYVDILKAKNKTDEKLVVVPIDSLIDRENIIPNLKYLIHLALDKDKPFAIITENE